MKLAAHAYPYAMMLVCEFAIPISKTNTRTCFLEYLYIATTYGMNQNQNNLYSTHVVAVQTKY